MSRWLTIAAAAQCRPWLNLSCPTDHCHKLAPNLVETQIALQDAWDWCDVSESSFTESAGDLSCAGKELGFSEFVLLCCCWCMLNVEQILRFAFTIYDKSNTGFIEMHELDDMMRELHKDDLKHGGVDGNGVLRGGDAIAAETFDMHGTGRISFSDLLLLNRRYPHLLFPVFHIQYSMQLRVLGPDYWETKQAESAARVNYANNGPDRLRAKADRTQRKSARRAFKKEGCCAYWCWTYCGRRINHCVTCGLSSQPQGRPDRLEGTCPRHVFMCIDTGLCLHVELFLVCWLQDP